MLLTTRGYAAPGAWFVEDNRTGVLARVYGTSYHGVEFLAAFEYIRNCDPIFSMLQLRETDLGTLLNKSAFLPNEALLIVNYTSYTWHGAEAQYRNGTEIGIGITKEAWNALLNHPKSISFTDRRGFNYVVPIQGISNALVNAAQRCLNRQR